MSDDVAKAFLQGWLNTTMDRAMDKVHQDYLAELKQHGAMPLGPAQDEGEAWKGDQPMEQGGREIVLNSGGKVAAEPGVDPTMEHDPREHMMDQYDKKTVQRKLKRGRNI